MSTKTTAYSTIPSNHEQRKKHKRCTEEHNKNVKNIFGFAFFPSSIVFFIPKPINIQHKQDMKFVVSEWERQREKESKHALAMCTWGRLWTAESLLTPTALLWFLFECDESCEIDASVRCSEHDTAGDASLPVDKSPGQMEAKNTLTTGDFVFCLLLRIKRNYCNFETAERTWERWRERRAGLGIFHRAE